MTPIPVRAVEGTVTWLNVPTGNAVIPVETYFAVAKTAPIGLNVSLSVSSFTHALAPRHALSENEIDTLLDELAGISANWGYSSDDLLEQRRQERELEFRRSQ